jgi:hypothetical protein
VIRSHPITRGLRRESDRDLLPVFVFIVAVLRPSRLQPASQPVPPPRWWYVDVAGPPGGKWQSGPAAGRDQVASPRHQRPQQHTRRPTGRTGGQARLRRQPAHRFPVPHRRQPPGHWRTGQARSRQAPRLRTWASAIALGGGGSS